MSSIDPARLAGALILLGVLSVFVFRAVMWVSPAIRALITYLDQSFRAVLGISVNVAQPVALASFRLGSVRTEVHQSDGGGYIVILRNPSTGAIDASMHGFKSLDVAIEQAKRLIR